MQSEKVQERLLRRRRTSSRRWLMLLLLGLILLGGGWTALWFYAVHRAGSELDAAITRDAAKGRIWMCPDRAFGGYPLEISLSCRNPSFAGKADGKAIEVKAASLHAKIAFYDPNRVVAEVEGPLHATSSDGTKVHLTWASLTLNLIGPMKFTRGSLELGRPAMTVSVPGESDVAVASAGASLRLTALDRRSAQDSDQEIRLQIADLVAPALDQAFGSSQPATFDATAVVSDVDAAIGQTLVERLDNWRAGGGRVRLATASLAKGSARLEAAGLLGLDDAHRISGIVSLGLTGAKELIQQAQLPIQADGLGLLGSLLGGEGPELPAHGGPQPDMKLALKFAKGHISIGPIRWAKLTPIY